MIPFNKPPYIGKENEYITEAIKNCKICGDGPFSKKCHEWIEEKTGTKKALLTTSGSAALEMSALLSDIRQGDEVIMPSYTFVSTANAFVLRGAKIKFVDIRPDTMNIDENLIENAITNKTKAIVPVHYAGVACEMNKIMDIANEYKLKVIEDAAQAVDAFYYGKALGTFGNLGCYSFHETKNFCMGEGGAILIRDEEDELRAEIVREKGTNRNKFFRGQVDKYSWIDVGSSYLPSDINAAYLWGQLERSSEISENRMQSWNMYQKGLYELYLQEKIGLPTIPEGCKHNAHMFYIKTRSYLERSKLIDFLKDKGIMAVFHYVPLHTSLGGKKFGEFIGEDRYTTSESEKIIRLPMYYGLLKKDVEYVIACIEEFYRYFD